jgi:hypothetical protein
MNNILNLIIAITAIIVTVAAFTATFYLYITMLYKSSPLNMGVGFYNKIKLSVLSSIGTVSTQVNSTAVELTDNELNDMLQVIFNQIGTSKYISFGILESLGLNTASVIQYLEALGYIIY